MYATLVSSWLLALYIKYNGDSQPMFQKDPDGTKGVINVHGDMLWDNGLIPYKGLSVVLV